MTRRKHEDVSKSKTPGSLRLLDYITVTVGAAWALLAAAKFFLDILIPGAGRSSLMPLFYYVCIGIAAAHLVDSIRAKRRIYTTH